KRSATASQVSGGIVRRVTALVDLLPASSASAADRDAAAALLDGMLAAGRETWPGVDLDPEAFARGVADRLPAEGDAAAALGALHAADVYLACACARGDGRALAAFERRYIAGVPAFLARTAWASSAAEVQQAVRERL